MHRIITLIAIFISASAIASYPQVPDTIWAKTFGGADHDYAYDLKQTSDGGFIIGGVTSSYGTGWWNVYLIKTDTFGDTVWTRYYSADGPDIVYCVQQTVEGGYVAACEGFTNLIKFNESGDSIWTRNYGIIPFTVRQTADSGYILGGSAIVGGFAHPCLIKTDSSGDTVWQHTYIMEETGAINDLCFDSDGGYIAIGSSHSAQGCWDYFMLKTNATGDSVWMRLYGRIGEPDEAYAIEKTIDGGYVITGLYFWTVKTDALGDTLWTRYYGAGEISCAFSIEQTADSGFIIGGYLDPIQLDDDDAQFYIVKTDNQGAVIWEKLYGDSVGWDMGQTILQTEDGDFVMAGWTNSFGQGGMDAWLLRLSSGGSPCIYTPGDANADETTNGLDVVYMVNYLKSGSNPPPYQCDCPPHGFIYVAADANGSCSFNGLDVTYLVGYFKGSGNSPSGCPECPPPD